MDLGVRSRIALVTGSSQGIGRSIAEALAREGASVAVTYRHDKDRAEAVAASVRAAGADAMVTFLDLASHESIVSAIDQVLNRWGHIDILVNNAVRWADHRVSEAPPFERLPPEEWRDLLRSNIEGVYAAVQAVLPSMRERQWGRIVNISGVVAADGACGATWYATAKSALHGFTRSLAKEVGGDGILVNAVMPGLTLTERAVAVVADRIKEENARGTPIGRLLQPDEIAATVVFLASAANTAITGEVIRASGGYIMPHRPPNAAPRMQSTVHHENEQVSTR